MKIEDKDVRAFVRKRKIELASEGIMKRLAEVVNIDQTVTIAKEYAEKVLDEYKRRQNTGA